MTWAVPPVARDQLVLLASSLDEVIPEDHLVAALDAHRVALRQRLTAESSSEQMPRRQSEGERPFAVVKQQFGIRQLPRRETENVKRNGAGSRRPRTGRF